MTDYRAEARKRYLRQSKPTLLNSFFKVRFYNGGNQGEEYKIENILDIDINSSEKPKQHCSKEGENYDLILEYTGQQNVCSVSHISILGCPVCTSPIKNGVFMVLRQIPDTDEGIVEWGKQWNDINTSKEIEEMDIKDGSIDGKPLYFETHDQLCNFSMAFNTLRTGSFVYFKFISGPDRNIDVRQIAIFGLIGDKSLYPSYNPSDENVFEKYNTKVNRFRYFPMYEYFFREPCLVVCSRNQSLRDIVKSIVRTDENLVAYYLPQDVNVTNLRKSISEFDFGLRYDNIELKDGIYFQQKIASKGIDRRWKLDAPFTRTRIQEFIQGVRQKSQTEWIRESQPPQNPISKNGILTLVRSTYLHEIRQRKCGRPALVSFALPALPNFGCENFLEEVKKKYGDRLIVATYDVKQNDMPFYVSVGCYFYKPDLKERPVHYDGRGPTPSKEGFLKFVDTMMSKFSTVKFRIVPSTTTTTSDDGQPAASGGEEEEETEGEKVLPKKDGTRIELQGFTLVFRHKIENLKMMTRKRSHGEVMKVIRSNKSSQIGTTEIMKMRHALSTEYVQLSISKNDEGRIVMVQKSMEQIEQDIWPNILKVLKKNEDEIKLSELIMGEHQKKCRYAYINPFFVAFVPVITASTNIILQFRVGSDQVLVSQFIEFVKNMFLD